MRRALAELVDVPANFRSSLRVIVFFSDGAPNTVAGDFNNGGTIVRGDLYLRQIPALPLIGCSNITDVINSCQAAIIDKHTADNGLYHYRAPCKL